MSGRRALVLAACVILPGCADTKQASNEATEPLVPVDSVVLAESDSTFVGAPTHMTVAPNGDLFISDAVNSTVLRFARDGRFLRRYGRAGAGPGEFGTPVATALGNDSVLAVADWRHNRTSLFSTRSGAYLTGTQHEGVPFSLHFTEDTLWMGDVNFSRLTTLAKWQLGDTPIEYFGPVPAEYRQSRQLMLSHPYASITLRGDSLLVGVTGHDGLFLVRRDGSLLDTIKVPVVRRRGVPADMVQQFTKSLSDAEIARMASALVGLYQRPGGGIAVMYFDVEIVERTITADGYLSLVAPDRLQICSDVPVPFGKDGRPVVSFARDTLYALETHLRDGVRAENILKVYPLADVQCAWADLD